MENKIRLIPYPYKVRLLGGFLSCAAVNPTGEDIKSAVTTDLFEKYGIAVSADGIRVNYSRTVSDNAGREGYVLDISQDGVCVNAQSDAGVLYATVTIIQLLCNYDGKLPLCVIEDRPAVSYRGFMLDSGRYFFPKSDVLKLIDLCVLHKINVFHWHLTEDQGWRIQIDKYPLLTEKGSRRSHTNFGFRPHGGYYTKEDVREIVEYCKARNISVIPEFDIPGHSRAALACYPQLGCFGRKLSVATHSGVKHDIMCAGKESTYTFVYDVIDELIEMFGDNTRFIHLGGDEAVKTRWDICPHCREMMQKQGIATTEGLQAYFMQRVAQRVIDRGFIPVMWNPSDASYPCNGKTVWQFWTSEGANAHDLARRACEDGGLINSDSAYVYLDLPYAYINLEKSYSFSPVPQGAVKEKFIGAECALWTEYVPDFNTACRRTLPRLCAAADVIWGRYGGDFEEFSSRLGYYRDFLEKNGYCFASRKTAMPGKIRAFLQKLWFERRQLHWQGLHNLVEDAAVKIKYGKKR